MASHSHPSFFKVLIDPFAPHLPLPQDFVSLHMKNKIPKNPRIQCERGGYSWQLEIEKIGQFYCFTHGWKNVVDDVKLGIGDFLVFWQVNHATFKVEILTQNGCEKVLPPKVKFVHDGIGSGVNADVDGADVDDADVDVDDVADVDGAFVADVDGADVADMDGADVDVDDVDYGNGHGVDPSFTTIISHNGTTLRFPTKFTELAGINRERMIIVISLDGNERLIKLLSDHSNVKTRYLLSSGWSNFRRSNDLSEGDECVIKYIKSEDKLCLVKVTKKKPRARGRPRKQKLGRPPK